MGGPGWHAKFRQLCSEIAAHVVTHPILVRPKRSSRPLPTGWVEPERVSGPVPALPEGWHEPPVNDQLPRRSA